MTVRHSILLSAGVAALYAVLYLSEFSATPLGQVPVLDGRENIDIARAIVAGELPQEPFFRAMGWPLLLSVGAALGFDDSGMMLLAGGLGILFHAAAAGSTAALAAWLVETQKGSAMAAFFSGLLYALHPVAVYFAAEPLDTTAGLSPMLFGLVALLVVQGGARFAAGALLMAAVLVRPHALPVLLAAPFLILLMSQGLRRASLVQVGSFVCGALPVASAYLFWQASLGGGLALLPSQGAYNFHISNGTDANGRSFVQKALLAESEIVDGHGRVRNPAGVESEKRFAALMGRPHQSLQELNTFWRDRTLGWIKDNPGAWLALMGRKLVYLLNDFEQYNNKTYAFHREQAFFLRWNPLSWGWLFVLGAAGASLIPREASWRFWALILAAAAYAAGALLFISSDKFRLPLAPLVAVLAGSLALPDAVQKLRRSKQFCLMLASMALAALVTFPPWLNAPSTETFIQDRLLIANAALSVGEDAMALTLAREAEVDAPQRPDIARLQAMAIYNLHVSHVQPAKMTDWIGLLQKLGKISDPEPRDRFIAGVALLQVERNVEGIQVLTRLAEKLPRHPVGREAAAVLLLAGKLDSGGDMLQILMGTEPIPRSRLVRAALASVGKGPMEDKLSPLERVIILGPAGE